MKLEKFYIVFVEGGKHPTVKHTDLEVAKAEAARLANNTVSPAYVMGVEGLAYKRPEPVVYVEQGADCEDVEVMPKQPMTPQEQMDELMKDLQHKNFGGGFPNVPFYPPAPPMGIKANV